MTSPLAWHSLIALACALAERVRPRAGSRAFPLARRPAHDARRLSVSPVGRRTTSGGHRVARLQRHVQPAERGDLAHLPRLGGRTDRPRLCRADGRQFRAAATWRDVLGRGLRPQPVPQPPEGRLRRARLSAGAGLRARRPHRRARLVGRRRGGADVGRATEPRPSPRPGAARFPCRGGVLPGLVPHRSRAGGMDDTDSAAGIAG